MRVIIDGWRFELPSDCVKVKFQSSHERGYAGQMTMYDADNNVIPPERAQSLGMVKYVEVED